MSATLIPGYRIIKLLGEGGMAKVYLAVQQSFDRQVALKIMSPQLASGDPQYGERFIREARIVAQLMHPHIVTVFDVGVHDGLHYLSMEYVPGQDLRLRRESLTLKQNLLVIKQIATALDFAHKKGYIHRDIKPENILIHEQDGRAILTDFGIARIAGTQENLTQTGTAIGTPNFMSPEQALGKPVDHRSDLYSLGVVLFYVLTGRVPFTADSAVAIGLKHAVEPIPRVEGAFIQFQPVLEKVMAKQADRRYQSGQEFAEMLDGILNKVGADTEQLWRESFGQGADKAAAAPAVAQVVSLKPTAPKQQTPLIAKREGQTRTPTTFYQIEKPPSRVGFKLLLLLLLAVIVTLQLKPEWAVQARAWVMANVASKTEPGASVATVATAPISAMPSAPLATPAVVDTPPVETVDTVVPDSRSTDTVDATNAGAATTVNPYFEQLSLAKQLLDNGDLIEPEAQNAESVYRQILQTDSNHAEAKDGLMNVGIALAARGLRFADNGDLSRAQRDYERALMLAPRDRDVQYLKQRLALLAHDKDASDLVVKARSALKSNRWLLPDGDNAQEYFQKALTIQPANRDAINGSKELEQTIANRVRYLWQRKQYAEASDLLALAQKRYIASDALDAVAAQTVSPATTKAHRVGNNDASVTPLAAPAAGVPAISNLTVSMQTDLASSGKFLQAKFDFVRASETTQLAAQVVSLNTKKIVTQLPVKLNQASGEMSFTVATLDEKFVDGQYSLELYLGDKKLAMVNFSVGR